MSSKVQIAATAAPVHSLSRKTEHRGTFRHWRMLQANVGLSLFCVMPGFENIAQLRRRDDEVGWAQRPLFVFASMLNRFGNVNRSFSERSWRRFRAFKR